MHATLENPCYCFCHASGNEDECRYCKKVNKIVAKALHQYAEELKNALKNRKIGTWKNWIAATKKYGGTKEEWNRLQNGKTYDEVIDDIISLLEREGEKE